MKPTNTFFIVMLLFMGFAQANAQSTATTTNHGELITNDYPEAKAEIRVILDGIFKSIQERDIDKLLSYHAYSPKFTEFKDGGMRNYSEGNQEYERGLLNAISGFEYDLEDLLINVFGDVAVVTFHANFRPVIQNEEKKMTGQVTLVFVDTPNSWKITHEHFSPLLAKR